MTRCVSRVPWKGPSSCLWIFHAGLKGVVNESHGGRSALSSTALNSVFLLKMLMQNPKKYRLLLEGFLQLSQSSQAPRFTGSGQIISALDCHHHQSISRITSSYRRCFANFHGSPVFHALGVLSCTASFSPQATAQYAYE